MQIRDDFWPCFFLIGPICNHIKPSQLNISIPSISPSLQVPETGNTNSEGVTVNFAHDTG